MYFIYYRYLFSKCTARVDLILCLLFNNIKTFEYIFILFITLQGVFKKFTKGKVHSSSCLYVFCIDLTV